METTLEPNLPQPAPAMTATFVFVDMAGFTALTESHGDEAAADLVARFQEIVGAAAGVEAAIVDAIGDGAFLVAPDPDAGLRAMLRLWASVAREAGFPAIRAGMHHGEAVRRGERYFGTSVNLAARLAAQARGDEIVATSAVAAAATTRGMQVTSLGPLRLRNLTDPVEAFSLVVAEEAGPVVVDPICRMKLDPRRAAGELVFEGRRYWFCSLECSARFALEPARYAAPE